MPLCKLPEVDPCDPDPAEAARAAAAMAVEEVLDAASAISPLIARLRYVGPANADMPDEYRLGRRPGRVVVRPEERGPGREVADD